MTDAPRRLPARPRVQVVALLVALLPAFAGVALAARGSTTGAPGLLKGKLTGWERLLPQVYSEGTKSDARRYSWREPSPTVKQEFRKLSANVARDVCIVAMTGGAAPAHEPVSVRVTGGRATPATLVLAPGSRVSFKNFDPFAHELYEAGNPAWAQNQLAPGSSREWSSSTSGVHVIRDQLFPSVLMFVVIDPAALEFALPDHEGAFSMSLPPGDYGLKAFFDGKPVGKESVHVGAGGFDLREPMVLGGGDAK